MKRTVAPFLICLVAFHFSSYAQSIENKLTIWAKNNPVEKLYLHTDRESYLAGQTVWFKGYFTTGFVPSGNSSTLYVELLNNQSGVIIRNVFPAYLGSSLGQIDLPENLKTGTYIVRAYAPLMLNQPGFVFMKKMMIYGKEDKKAAAEKTPGKNQLIFFPEGGNLIAGILNIVAFKSTDKNGMPLDTEGEIQDGRGTIITRFRSAHDGMGTFAISPLQGETYYAVINGTAEKYELPSSTISGIGFSVKTTGDARRFKIQQTSSNAAFKPAYMIGQMENEIIFKQPLNGDKKEINGIIETGNFYSGILQLTVFNKDDMPLAERLTFIDNKDYILPAALKLDTLDTGKRKRNHFTITLQDTVIGNFSVSVTDADYESDENRPSNIYSWFLLSSDIKGYVHNPAYYFGAATDSVKNALDLVMMTNGWTRFKWTEVAQNTLPPARYKDPGYIQISGKINIEGTRKVLDNKDLIMIMSPADTTQNRRGTPRFIHTDSLGYFRLDSMVFYDKMKILFSDIRGKKSKYISVKLESDSLRRSYPLAPGLIPFSDTGGTVLQDKMASAYTDYLNTEGVTLANVTVKARQKSEIEKLDEEYASGLFSGGINSRTFDLRNEVFGGDIFQYLQGRVAGLSVTGSPGNYTISYRGGGFGGSNVTLFLDEMQTDASMIETTPVNQIAMIKLLPNSPAAPGSGTVLAIYTKKGADLSAALESPTDIINYNGYTIVKEFYNPDYDKQPDTEKADNRITLNWNPNLFIANVNPQIPVIFYNNDRTRRFKIVAEGITNDGRMLMLEKIIAPQPVK